MPGEALNTAVEKLRGLVAAGVFSAHSDGQLLELFLRRRDEAAFATLVQRHGPMVLGVCRRVLGDPHEAEDAFQATFLVLVRKAAGIRNRQGVSVWLYGVAWRTALQLKTRAATRRRHETRAAHAGEPAARAEDPELADLRRLLDEELSRLPAKYRDPLVLCHLEGFTTEQAARQLSWPTGTVAGRLARGRELLRHRLTRRGVALAAVLALEENLAPAAVPAALVVLTVQAASDSAAGTVSASVAALTQGVLRAMFLNKIKTAALVLLGIGISGGGLSLFALRTPAADPQDARPGDAPTRPDEAKARNQDREQMQGFWNVVHAGKDGQSVASPDGLKQVRVLIHGDSLILLLDPTATREGGHANVFVFRLNPSRAPKAIDLTDQTGDRKQRRGIYELTKDTLELFWGEPGEDRPTKLGAGGPGRSLLRLKRDGEVEPTGLLRVRLLNDAAQFYLQSGHAAEAEKALRVALTQSEQLAREFPQSARCRQELARGCDGLGEVMRTTGRLAEAEATYRRALALREKLVTEAPDNRDYRRDLAESYRHLSKLLAATGRAAEAEEALRRALALKPGELEK
jgi:RNA polymerase sigma factor (sigma-70 family)